MTKEVILLNLILNQKPLLACLALAEEIYLTYSLECLIPSVQDSVPTELLWQGTVQISYSFIQIDKLLIFTD